MVVVATVSIEEMIWLTEKRQIKRFPKPKNIICVLVSNHGYLDLADDPLKEFVPWAQSGSWPDRLVNQHFKSCLELFWSFRCFNIKEKTND